MLINLSVANQNLAAEQGEIQLWELFLEKLKSDAFLQEQVSTFVVSYNNGLADIVRNAETEIVPLWGEGVIYEILDFSQFSNSKATNQEQTSLKFRISPSSFFQTNTLGAQKLF